MKNYTSFYGGEKKSFYGSFIQNMGEERVLKRGPAQTVSFDEEQLVQLLSLIVNFYPIQNGSGQPSPENIRAISGRTFADICISPTLDSEDGKIYHVEFPTQVGTAYGGTIDMINKTLTINYLYRTFTGQEDWEMFIPSKTVPYCRLVLGNFGSVVNDSGVCSHFPNKIINSSQLSVEDGSRIVNSMAIPYAIICIRYAEKQQTVDDFKNWLREQYNAGTPVQIAYKISNPTVYNIDIDPVILYPNDNNIWIENGDVIIQYKINKNVYYNTANGNPCVLDKSVNMPITNLLLNIQPVQDLHGYDAPWPAGGGKNLLDYDTALSNAGFIKQNDAWYAQKSNIVINKVLWENTNEVSGSISLSYFYKFAYSATTARGVRFVFKYSDGTTVDNNVSLSETYVEKVVTSDPTKTLSSIMFTYGTSSVSTWIKNIQVEFGSPTTWVPYANICPITGWTGAKVTRCGKNLVPMTAQSRMSSGITYTVNTDGSVTINGTATATSWLRGATTEGERQFLRAGTYHLSGTPSGRPFTVYIVGSYIDGTTLLQSNVDGGVYDTGNGLTFTLLKDATVTYQIQVNNGVSVDNVTAYPQIELGSTVTDYEPYQGETYSVTFPSEAGTVYGGTLDVTRGLLTVTHKFYENAGTGNWAEQLTGGNRYYIGGVSTDAKNLSTNGISNIGELVSAFNINGIVVGANGRINICGDLHDAFATVDDLKAYFAQNPLQVVYELASPITYQLTPAQINALDKLTILTTDVDNITATYKAKNK